MWQYKKMDDLSAKELHQILKERVKIFVVEQACAFQEVDDTDLNAIHVIKRTGYQLDAYARIYQKDGKLWIGRVMVPEYARGAGMGRQLLEAVMDYINTHYPDCEVHMQAEAYLKSFYESFGFKTVSDLYYDFDIGHYDMKLTG